MILKKKDVVELHVDDLAFGGQGVAKLDGKVIFVQDGLPGDFAKVIINRIKPDYCEGRVIEIINPSPYRIKPLCQHFEICGGCRWQNFEYDKQLEYKAEQLRNNLIRIGGIENPYLEPIISAKKIYNYRNKMEYSFNRNKDGDLFLGLHYAGFFDKVFNVEKCCLQSELSSEIVVFVRDECSRLKLPAYHIRNHIGLMRFLVVREGKFTGETLVNIVTSDQFEGYEDRLLGMGNNIASKFENINSILWTINSKKANIAIRDMLPPMLKNGIINGRDFIYEKLNNYRFRISADNFFQTNSFQAQVLYDTIIEYAEFNELDKVVDLYCGTGTIAIYISNLVKSVVGVEIMASSIDDAYINAKDNGIHNVEFVAGKVEDVVKEIGAYNKMIIDPPRAGLHPKALKGIIEIKPQTIIYVSCNPSTLARDIAGLVQAGYKLSKATAVDMFPHTYHIESIAKLELK